MFDFYFFWYGTYRSSSGPCRNLYEHMELVDTHRHPNVLCYRIEHVEEHGQRISTVNIQ